MAELRTALLTAPIGDAAGSGQFLANVRAMLNLAPAPDRPAPQDPDQPRHRAIPNIVVPPGQEAAAPSGDPLAVTLTAGHDRVSTPSGPEPHAAGDPGAMRVISLQVGPNPNLDENPALIAYEGSEELGTRNGYSGGWLESYVRFYAHGQQGMPGFEFQNASPGDLEYWASVSGADQRIDTVALSGDFSAGFSLSGLPTTINDLILREGNDYSLVMDDSFVSPGRTLTVHGDGIGVTGRVIFDGSGESDGAFSFFGSDNDDFFFGGAANDTVRGMGGADTLSGGGGSDTFLYRSAGDSTGAAFDILADFDPAADRIDLPVTVTGFDAAVTAGTLSVASAGGDLAAALGGLGAGHAVVFTPDAGDLAGAVFLVVDGNGVAGYQEGEDYVFALPGTPPADLSAHPAFFI